MSLELIDFDEDSLHDSILGDDHSECSEISFDGSSSSFAGDDSMQNKHNSVSSLPKAALDANSSIPPELLMEDPSLAEVGRKWVPSDGLKKTPSGRWSGKNGGGGGLTRQDSWASVTSFVSTSGDSVDTFVLSKTARLQ